MNSKQVVVAAAALLSVQLNLGAVAPASAQDEEDPAAEALELMKKGQGQYDDKQYAAALRTFDAALQLGKDPGAILMMAHCHRQLGYDARALKAYRLYLAEWERLNPGQPAPKAEEANAQIVALEDKIRQRKAALAAAQARKRAEAKRRRGQLREGAAKRAKRAQQEHGRRSRRARVLRNVTIAGAALAASAAFTGGVFHATANRAPGDNVSARKVSITGFAMAGVFGAAAVTCGVLYLIARPGEKPAAAPPTKSAAVVPTPGGAAVTATLRF